MNVEIRPIKQIKAAKYNPRRISDQQLASLKASIERFGFVDPVIVNDRTGVLVGGHQRVRAAKDLGLKEVPVVCVNLDEGEEKALNVALNKISGEWDLDLLRGVLEDVQAEGLDLSLTGFTSEEWLAMSGAPAGTSGLADPDEVPEVDEEAAPISKPGDLWILGDHRLLCGDSTNAEDVAQVLDGDVGLQVMDPPFDLAYDAWRLESPKVVMVWGRGDEAVKWEASTLLPAGYGFHELVFTGGVRGWPCDWFPCTVHDVVRMYRNDKAVKSFDAQVLKQSGCRTTQDGSRPFSVQEHTGGVLTGYGGMSWGKPVMAMDIAMSYINQGEIVWDPCAGSGTSLIAAERMKRVWRGVEQQPKWADLIIRRWEEYTGRKAERA